MGQITLLQNKLNDATDGRTSTGIPLVVSRRRIAMNKQLDKYKNELEKEHRYFKALKFEESKIKAKEARERETDLLMQDTSIKEEAEARDMTPEAYARELQIRNNKVKGAKKYLDQGFGGLSGASDSDLNLDKLEKETTSALYTDLYKDNLSSVKVFAKALSGSDIAGSKGINAEASRVYGLAVDQAITLAKDKYEAAIRDKVDYNQSVKGTSRSPYDLSKEENKFSDLVFQKKYSLANRELSYLIAERKNAKQGVKAAYDSGQNVNFKDAGSGNTLAGVPKLPDLPFESPADSGMRELVPGTFAETPDPVSDISASDTSTKSRNRKPPSIKGFIENTAESKKYVNFKRLDFDPSMPEYVKDYKKYAEGFIRTYPTDQELRTNLDSAPNQGVIELSKTISYSDYERYKLRIQRVSQMAQERADEASKIADEAYQRAREKGDKRGTAISKGIRAAAEAGYSEKEILGNAQFAVDQSQAKKKEKALMDDGSFEFGTEFDGRNNEESRVKNKFGKGKFQSRMSGNKLLSNELTDYQKLRIKAINKVKKESPSPFRYGPPKDGETQEERRQRQMNNANIKREVDALRDSEKQKTLREAKSQTKDPNSIVAPAAGDGPLAGMTAESVAINRDDLSFKQKKNLQRNNINLDVVNEKRAAMLKLYQEGWATKDDQEKKKALYAIDSGYRRAAGTRSENWYLGVANQQILSFGKYLEDQQAAQGFATGGSINGGMDSVPAMLTPGEFVMSREAVAKHGVGYMKNLNMGKVTGFRRGGVVGTGNVQYKANGGSVGDGGGIMIDPSLLSGALDSFAQGFSEQISKLLGPMNTIANQLQGIADSFGSLTMLHTFGGELSMSVNISNKDAIIAAVSDGLLPMIADQIQRQIDASANSFKAGG